MMIKNTFFHLLLISILLFSPFFSCFAQANLLTNGGFETGDTTGWWEYIASDGSIAVVAGGSSEGTYHAGLTSNDGVWQTSLGQTVAVSAGQAADVSFDFNLTGAVWETASVSIDYYDTEGEWFNWEWFYLYADRDTDLDWTSYSNTFIVPTTPDPGSVATGPVAWMDIEFQAVGWGGTLGVDDVSIVPEPVTLVLMGLGSLAIARRKRA